MTADIISLERYRRARATCFAASNLLLQKQSIERPQEMTTMLKRGEQRWADHRDEPRHSAQGKRMPLITVNGKAARLEDVSLSGLKVRSDIDAFPGLRLLLAIAGFPSLSARVIWKRDGVMGLEAPMASMSLIAI